MKKTVAVLLVLLALGVGGAVFYVTRSVSLTGAPGTPPAPQPPVATLERGNLEPLRGRFNEATDTARLIVLLSPS